MESSIVTINKYDGFNRLKRSDSGDVTAEYRYNGEGLRISKTVNGNTTTHVWDGSNIAFETDSTGVETGYIRGINLVYADKGTVAYYLYNAHGDVVQLTSETGSLTKTYEYDAFGNEKNPDPGDTNPFRYCGEYFDKETGTIYLRARYYNPATGRFISEDSYWGDLKDPLSLNLYTYGGNNPILYIDPSGNSYTLTWKENMDWLPMVDLHLPVGDFIYYIGLGVSYCADNWGTISTVGPAAWEWTTDEAAPWVSNAARDTGNWISDKATKGWNWLKSQFGGGSSGSPDPNDLKKAVEANEGAGSTGRKVANDLNEQLVMKQVKSNPMNGATKVPIELKDTRWPATDGWIKMQNVVKTSEGKITIHFNYNTNTGATADFKFK